MLRSRRGSAQTQGRRDRLPVLMGNSKVTSQGGENRGEGYRSRVHPQQRQVQGSLHLLPAAPPAPCTQTDLIPEVRLPVFREAAAETGKRDSQRENKSSFQQFSTGVRGRHTAELQDMVRQGTDLLSLRVS